MHLSDKKAGNKKGKTMGTVEITREQEDMIAQVASTMAIEDMPLTERACHNLAEAASGKKTADQIAGEIAERYRNAR